MPKNVVHRLGIRFYLYYQSINGLHRYTRICDPIQQERACMLLANRTQDMVEVGGGARRAAGELLTVKYLEVHGCTDVHLIISGRKN